MRIRIYTYMCKVLYASASNAIDAVFISIMLPLIADSSVIFLIMLPLFADSSAFFFKKRVNHKG